MKDYGDLAYETLFVFFDREGPNSHTLSVVYYSLEELLSQKAGIPMMEESGYVAVLCKQFNLSEEDEASKHDFKEITEYEAEELLSRSGYPGEVFL